jgi:hypothetical protein
VPIAVPPGRCRLALRPPRGVVPPACHGAASHVTAGGLLPAAAAPATTALRGRSFPAASPVLAIATWRLPRGDLRPPWPSPPSRHRCGCKLSVSHLI